MDTREFLTALGFERGTGFLGEVWTNTDSAWMTQVWVYFYPQHMDFHLSYYAYAGFDSKKFFRWWEEVSDAEHFERN